MAEAHQLPPEWKQNMWVEYMTQVKMQAFVKTPKTLSATHELLQAIAKLAWMAEVTVANIFDHSQ